MRHIDFAKQPDCVALAAHAIGLDHKRSYIRQGKKYYRPYRNYFTTHDKSSDYRLWQDLCNKGYAISRSGHIPGNVSYSLTTTGMEWLGTKLNVMIQEGGH